MGPVLYQINYYILLSNNGQALIPANKNGLHKASHFIFYRIRLVTIFCIVTTIRKHSGCFLCT